MVDAKAVEAKISQVINTAQKSFKQESEANYLAFQAEIDALEGLAREALQARLEEMLWPILAKLEEGQPLTAAEHEVLELLIVGEAEYYLQSENELDHWRRELERLLDEINKQQALGLDEIDSLMKIRALCREALRVLPDMAYYFHEQERVQKFREMTRDAIDTETRRSLANLIKEMIESDQI